MLVNARGFDSPVQNCVSAMNDQLEATIDIEDSENGPLVFNLGQAGTQIRLFGTASLIHLEPGQSESLTSEQCSERGHPVAEPTVHSQESRTIRSFAYQLHPRVDVLSHRDADDTSWRDWVRPVLTIACLVASAVCFVKSMSNSPQRGWNSAATPPVMQTRMIQDFDVGMRAMGTNPDRSQVESAPEPDPATSRKLMLRMEKEGGGRLTVKLLRPLAWVQANCVVQGGTFFLDLPEMGAVGDAHVEAVLPCPPLAPGSGNVVTGTFAHEATAGQKILSVTFANGAHIHGVTDNHPVYSVDRQEFLPIGEMLEGETVQIQGGTTRITALATRPARAGEMLYNLETHNEHVYQVTTAGVVVHNSCITDIRFSGGRGIDSLRNATQHDITKAFSQSGFKPSSHFITRIKDLRTERMGLNTFNDLQRMFQRGTVVNANDGLKALVHGDMAIIFNPKTNVLVTLTPWTR